MGTLGLAVAPSITLTRPLLQETGLGTVSAACCLPQVELLESTMVDKMFTIDMNSKLKLSALMVPRMGKNPTPLVSMQPACVL